MAVNSEANSTEQELNSLVVENPTLKSKFKTYAVYVGLVVLFLVGSGLGFFVTRYYYLNNYVAAAEYSELKDNYCSSYQDMVNLLDDTQSYLDRQELTEENADLQNEINRVKLSYRNYFQQKC